MTLACDVRAEVLLDKVLLMRILLVVNGVVKATGPKLLLLDVWLPRSTGLGVDDDAETGDTVNSDDKALLVTVDGSGDVGDSGDEALLLTVDDPGSNKIVADDVGGEMANEPDGETSLGTWVWAKPSELPTALADGLQRPVSILTVVIYCAYVNLKERIAGKVSTPKPFIFGKRKECPQVLQARY